jgi:hypothetical protein
MNGVLEMKRIDTKTPEDTRHHVARHHVARHDDVRCHDVRDHDVGHHIVRDHIVRHDVARTIKRKPAQIMEKTRTDIETVSIVKILDGEPVGVTTFRDSQEGVRQAFEEGTQFLIDNSASQDEVDEWTQTASEEGLEDTIWWVGTYLSIYLARGEVKAMVGKTPRGE